MSKKTNTLLASAVAAGVLLMSAQPASAAAPAAAGAVEQRLKMMEDQLTAMKAEVARVRAESASARKVADLEEKVARQPTASGKGKKGNMVFFRGGYTAASHGRSGELLSGPEFGGPFGDGLVAHQNHEVEDGWYTGAGFDFSLSDNLFGLTNQAEVLAELMFDYKNFGSSFNPLIKNYTGGAVGAVVPVSIKNQVTMFSLSASPKIKFMPGSAFRPWIIPVGLAVHVISPPSSGVTVLNPGLMVGAGADYQIWKDIYAGADFRYNFTGNDLSQNSQFIGGGPLRLKGTNTDGFTTGGYLGIGF